MIEAGHKEPRQQMENKASENFTPLPQLPRQELDTYTITSREG